MKRISLLTLIASLLLLATTGDGQTRKSPGKPTGVTGRVYRTGGPAQRLDWTPPPLERITPIDVLDTLHHVIKTVHTDRKGKFTIPLRPGVYYFLVKEAFIPGEEGPVTVTKDSLHPLKLHFDTGIR